VGAFEPPLVLFWIRRFPPALTSIEVWPLQGIVLRLLCTKQSSLFVLPPPTCIAHTIAILLHVYCAIYDAPPAPLVYATHHTILVIAISCKGQVTTPTVRIVEAVPAASTTLYTGTFLLDESLMPTRRVGVRARVTLNPIRAARSVLLPRGKRKGTALYLY